MCIYVCTIANILQFTKMININMMHIHMLRNIVVAFLVYLFLKIFDVLEHWYTI